MEKNPNSPDPMEPSSPLDEEANDVTPTPDSAPGRFSDEEPGGERSTLEDAIVEGKTFIELAREIGPEEAAREARWTKPWGKMGARPQPSELKAKPKEDEEA